MLGRDAPMHRAAAAVLLATLAACTTFSDDLRRAERLYDDARYEDALEWLSVLDDERIDGSTRDRLRFSYLRGMTAYRLDARDDALHYLSVAAVLAKRDPEGLPSNRRAVLERTLEELTPTDATHRARRPR